MSSVINRNYEIKLYASFYQSNDIILTVMCVISRKIKQFRKQEMFDYIMSCIVI